MWLKVVINTTYIYLNVLKDKYKKVLWIGKNMEKYIIFIFGMLVGVGICLFLFSLWEHKEEEVAKPVHSPEEVEANVKEYLSLYYALSDIVISTPIYKNGSWFMDVNFKFEGNPSSLKIKVNDTNLTPEYICENIPIREMPVGVSKIFGKLSCGAEGKINLKEFADPYCPWSIAYAQKIKNIREKFSGFIEFEYHILLTHSLSLAQVYGLENVTLTAKYFVCAQKQKKLDEMQECVFTKYAKRSEVPLTKFELTECAEKIELETEELNKCISDEAGDIIAFDGKLAETYLERLSTPMMIVDCQYRVPPKYVENAICYIQPEVCK